MDWSGIIYATVLLLVLLLPQSVSDDRLALGKPLVPGTTIVSDSGVFALGFFSLADSTPANLYLGIWYNDIPRLTAVWVANRGNPATTGTSSAPPSLTLTNSSNLILSDASGRVLWTTNVTGVSGSAATAVLLNTGKSATSSSDLRTAPPHGRASSTRATRSSPA
jgi:hypothetical protein